jgi:NADH:ubiquinone oxidoreductase subunit 4 (subunit M)
MLTRAVLAVTVVTILVLGVYPNWVQRVVSRGLPRVERASAIGLLGGQPGGLAR